MLHLRSVRVRRTIRAPRKRVFAAFSNAAALPAWFSPHRDISVAVERFDFAPGGGFRLRYGMPDGTQPVVNGVFELIQADKRIVFTWIWEPPDPHSDVPTRVSVGFMDSGSDTEVVLMHEHLPDKEAGPRYVAGWEGTLSRLEHMLIPEMPPAVHKGMPLQ